MGTASPIISPSNPLVKQARALRRHKTRAETRLFLVEGIHHVGEAVEAGWEIDVILYAPDLLASVFAWDLISHAGRQNLRLQPVAAQVMESLSEKDNPQGILAIVRQKTWRLDDLSPQIFRIGAAVVAPQDPGNVGTLLRTLDAAGADGLILLDGGVEPYHPACVRASMGTLFWKPIVQAKFTEFVIWARRGGYQLIGASAHAGADYYVFSPHIPWLLLLGSEQKGLSAEQLAACDAAVSLPMRGRASSLNLAVAAGILLYQFTVDKTG